MNTLYHTLSCIRTVSTTKIFLLYFLIIGACGVVKAQGGRIINGVDAKKGVWPWQVLIRFIEDAHCGGSIIDPFWVVTAAHCIKGKEPLMKEFKVV